MLACATNLATTSPGVMPAPIEDQARFRRTADLDDDCSPAIGTPVPFDTHHEAVAGWVARYTESLDLPPEVKRAVIQAAGWHDLGKLDPAFQVMLHGGDRFAATAAENPLGKSGLDPADRAAFRRAREASGYPKDARHELVSAALAKAVLDRAAPDDLDTDLVIHLVDAHHGFGRPLVESVPYPGWAPLSTTIEGITVDLPTEPGIDWDAPARFHRLQRRYRRWGLALLETIVRLADIECSESGT